MGSAGARKNFSKIDLMKEERLNLEYNTVNKLIMDEYILKRA